jgi:hypothetical protein
MRLLRPVVVLLTASLLFCASASAETRTGTAGPMKHFTQATVTYDDVAGSVTLAITWVPGFYQSFDLVLNTSCGTPQRGKGGYVDVEGSTNSGQMTVSFSGRPVGSAPIATSGDTTTATVTGASLQGLNLSCLQGTINSSSVGSFSTGVALTVTAPDPPAATPAPTPAPDPTPTPTPTPAPAPTTVTYTSAGLETAAKAFLAEQFGSSYTGAKISWLACPKNLINADARTGQCRYQFGSKTVNRSGTIRVISDQVTLAGDPSKVSRRVKRCSLSRRPIEYDHKFYVSGRYAWANADWCDEFDHPEIGRYIDSRAIYRFPGRFTVPAMHSDGWEDYPYVAVYHCNVKRKAAPQRGMTYWVTCASELGEGFQYQFTMWRL